MTNRLRSISSNNDLAYYTNGNYIQNTELVKDTVEYFDTGKGSRAFKPLEFLNLLEKQYDFVKENIHECEMVISHLNALPLSELERHILLGLMIKWLGGYPFNEGTDFDKNWLFTKKAIEKEFLNYPHETPEKEFCKADSLGRQDMMKLGIAFTTAINNNIDASELIASMGGLNLQKLPFATFDQLFEDAYKNGTLGEARNRFEYLNLKSIINFEFNVWLTKKFGWQIGDGAEYKKYLKKDTLIDFLKFKNQEEMNELILRAKEKLSWEITQHQQTKSPLDLPKTLSNLITHQKSYEIVKNIKVKYKNIKGKRLKLLLLAFQELELLPNERIALKFYDCCKKEFDWDIASYNAMNGYSFNDVIDRDEYTSIKQYLESIINTK